LVNENLPQILGNQRSTKPPQLRKLRRVSRTSEAQSRDPEGRDGPRLSRASLPAAQRPGHERERRI